MAAEAASKVLVTATVAAAQVVEMDGGREARGPGKVAARAVRAMVVVSAVVDVAAVAAEEWATAAVEAS